MRVRVAFMASSCGSGFEMQFRYSLQSYALIKISTQSIVNLRPTHGMHGTKTAP
jgi:hypothetical protein